MSCLGIDGGSGNENEANEQNNKIFISSDFFMCAKRQVALYTILMFSRASNWMAYERGLYLFLISVDRFALALFKLRLIVFVIYILMCVVLIKNRSLSKNDEIIFLFFIESIILEEYGKHRNKIIEFLICIAEAQ